MPSVYMLVFFCLIFAPFLCAWCVLGLLSVSLLCSLPLEATGGCDHWRPSQHTCSSSAVISTPIYIQTNLPDNDGSLNQSQWENASRTWPCSCVFETSAYLLSRHRQPNPSLNPADLNPEPEPESHHLSPASRKTPARLNATCFGAFNKFTHVLTSLWSVFEHLSQTDAQITVDRVCHLQGRQSHPFSKTFITRDVRATGLNSLSSLGLLALGTGILVDVFHIVGVWPLSTHIWDNSVNTSLSWSAQSQSQGQQPYVCLSS